MIAAHLPLSRSALDAAAERRTSLTWQNMADDAAARVVAVTPGGEVALVGGGGLELADGRAFVGEDETPWAFLGVDRSDGDRPWFAVMVEAGGESSARVEWTSLRSIGWELGDREVGALTSAAALAAWHQTARFCVRCGAATVPDQAGWVRRCVADGSLSYPRTDPAIIVALTDAQDRILLGHSAQWPEGRFSTLAGFVEAGEPLETAVRREVSEEVGLVVGQVDYVASQPWPFPASLMLGFRGRALTTDIRVDGVEVTQARWFARDELVAELVAGTVIPPMRTSIAWVLISQWLGRDLPETAAWN